MLAAARRVRSRQTFRTGLFAVSPGREEQAYLRHHFADEILLRHLPQPGRWRARFLRYVPRLSYGAATSPGLLSAQPGRERPGRQIKITVGCSLTVPDCAEISRTATVRRDIACGRREWLPAPETTTRRSPR